MESSKKIFDYDTSRIEKLISLYDNFLKQDYLIATHSIPIETLNEAKALNDNLAITINSEIKLLERKYDYFPLPYITDKMMGSKRVIKNNNKIKVKHLLPIKSIDKMELDNKLSDVFYNISNLIVMPKYDGISCVCWYNPSITKDDSLVFATKSNDIEGENITHICKHVVDTKKLNLFFVNNPEIIKFK